MYKDTGEHVGDCKYPLLFQAQKSRITLYELIRPTQKKMVLNDFPSE
jgi:hypothetical protein